MAKNAERIAKKLGAKLVDTVPEYSAGAFGAAKLAKGLQERLSPSVGKRPGRPTNPAWTKRLKVAMASETDARLEELARMLSSQGRKVSKMQLAAEILERGIASFFPRRTLRPKGT